MVSLQEASTVIVVDIILAAGRLGAFFLLCGDDWGDFCTSVGKLAMTSHPLKSVDLG